MENNKDIRKKDTAKSTAKKKTSSHTKSGKKKSGKKSTWKLPVTIGVMVGLLICLGLIFYISVGNMYFLKGTTINGRDVSGKTLTGAVNMLAKEYNNKEISILENGEVTYNKKVSELGYKVDEEGLTSLIRQEMDEQKDKVFLQFFAKKNSEVELPFLYGSDEISSEIVEANLKGDRTESKNAELVFGDGTYHIQDEVYGNKIIEDKLQQVVKEQIEADMENTENIQIELTEEFYYQPEVTADNAELVQKMNAYNKYCKAVITHTFGSEKEVLNWDTIQNWLVLDGESVKLDEAKVEEYVDTLRRKYNTIYVDRSITTTGGEKIKLPSNDYGYRIDRAKEITQLTADITSNTTVEREPIYSHKGYHRNGRDDVLGCYIEINLTKQHIWLYKDYKLVVESDIVTGDPGYQETQTGAFPIAFKKSPSVLSGETWNTEVQFWMPFHDGQGLHDATWRNKFGGEIYKTDGSHGCVNLPYTVAEKIYNSINAGYPIFLYKETAE